MKHFNPKSRKGIEIMTTYNVQIRVQNGGTQNIFTTCDRKYAACYCKSRNAENEKFGSPNRYFFETTEA